MGSSDGLLATAREGDEDAFAQLVAPYRAQLRVHCYRMLGSLPDAEDALQETLLRAWRGLSRFEGRSAFRAWLYRIATNACLRIIEKRPQRVLPTSFGPAADPSDHPADAVTEPLWLDPFPDDGLSLASDEAGPDACYEQRESIELAFTVALQELPARQRAVLIMREVLGFSARETAEVLDTSSVSVDSALQRARKTIETRGPLRSQQQTLRELGDAATREIVTRFAEAWVRRDVQALVGMLAEDARMTMPPQPSWYQGRDSIGEFLRAWPLGPDKRFRLMPVGSNGQPAMAAYMEDETPGTFEAESIIVLTLRTDGIAEVTAFRTPELFAFFGLPAHLTV